MLVVCHIADVIPWLLNDISTGCHAKQGMQGGGLFCMKWQGMH